MNKSEWIYPKDLQEGVEGLPRIDIQLQNTLRRTRKLTFTKVGNRVVYKREYIEDYLADNTKEANTKVDL